MTNRNARRGIRSLAAALVISAAVAALPSRADEGMHPVSSIPGLDLSRAGIALTPAQIYNPDSVSLMDAIVNVGGCSGAFVSADGLIITNHHCVFGALQAASTVANDYVTNGFLARTRSEEIPARGMSVRIIESVRDVSGRVLAALSDSLPATQRRRALSTVTRSIVQEAEGERPGTRAEVAEMFPGRSYLLFVYAFLRDVRLVYVPPRGIGEFGGEEDNWMWPRHTGDFAFIRAYADPGGTGGQGVAGETGGRAADPQPFRPRRFLKTQPAGVAEGDPVFILGYPGRTVRHRTAGYLAYEEFDRLPFLADLYESQIRMLEQLGAGDRAIALKHDARIKSLANNAKNYRGNLQGLKRLGLVEKKRADDNALQAFIDADPARRGTYGRVIPTIEEAYRRMRADAPRDLMLGALRQASPTLSIALTLLEAEREAGKKDGDRLPAQTDRNRPGTRSGIDALLRNYHEPADSALLRDMIVRTRTLPAGLRVEPIDRRVLGAEGAEDISGLVRMLVAGSKLADSVVALGAFDDPLEKVQAIREPMMDLARELLPLYDSLRTSQDAREGILLGEYAALIDVKSQYLRGALIPDGNGTMRMTHGRVRGYSPEDGKHVGPFTTVAELAAKSTGVSPFDSPDTLLDHVRRAEYGPYVHPRLGSVPVAFLYDLDTIRGNSGSAVMNARGEFVGVNFDRVFEATVNDYAWSDRYSRSIGVDIRYILWVTEHVGGASNVLQELGL
jgi:hypothetical protein